MGSPNMLKRSPNAGTSITTAETTLTWQGGSGLYTDIRLGLKRIEQCTFRIANVGATNALNTLKIYGKFTDPVTPNIPSDGWVPLATTTADYSGTANKYIMSSEVRTTSTWALVDRDATSIAKAQTAEIVMRTAGLQSIKITTSTASSTTTVTAWAHGSGVSAPLGSPMPVVPSSGLPTPPTVDVAGSDTYTTIVTVPATGPAHYMFVTVETKGAIISLDGGTTAHLTIPLDTNWLFEGLDIPAGAVIQGKNETAGQNYANLRIYVW